VELKVRTADLEGLPYTEKVRFVRKKVKICVYCSIGVPLRQHFV